MGRGMGCGGRCREVCWGVGGGKERCVGSGKVWGGVWESALGEWENVMACGERLRGEEWGRCMEVCSGVGPQHTSSHTSPHLLTTLTFPYISSYLPHTPTHFPTPPLIPLPTSPFLPHTLTHFPTIPTSSLTFSKCGKVTM